MRSWAWSRRISFDDLAHEALIPALAASAASFWAFTHVRPATPYFPIHFQYTPSTRDILVAIPLGLSAGLASHLFLGIMGKIRETFVRISEFRFRCTHWSGAGLLLVGIAYLRAIASSGGSDTAAKPGLPIAKRSLERKQFVFQFLSSH